MDVLTNLIVGIILKYIHVQIITLYTLNLHIYQLYLNKAGKKLPFGHYNSLLEESVPRIIIIKEEKMYFGGQTEYTY